MDKSFQARAMGLCLDGHHPIRSRGGYSNGPGLNASFRFDARALHDSPLGLHV
jgi:hypothetical protein